MFTCNTPVVLVLQSRIAQGLSKNSQTPLIKKVKKNIIVCGYIFEKQNWFWEPLFSIHPEQIAKPSEGRSLNVPNLTLQLMIELKYCLFILLFINLLHLDFLRFLFLPDKGKKRHSFLLLYPIKNHYSVHSEMLFCLSQL